MTPEEADELADSDPLGQYDNRVTPCPACGRMGEYCPRDLCDQFHDPCLGHIENARSACCGHGIGLGHVIIGDLVVDGIIVIEGEHGEA